jgi:hypothetical protein
LESRKFPPFGVEEIPARNRNKRTQMSERVRKLNLEPRKFRPLEPRKKQEQEEPSHPPFQPQQGTGFPQKTGGTGRGRGRKIGHTWTMEFFPRRLKMMETMKRAIKNAEYVLD